MPFWRPAKPQAGGAGAAAGGTATGAASAGPEGVEARQAQRQGALSVRPPGAEPLPADWATLSKGQKVSFRAKQRAAALRGGGVGGAAEPGAGPRIAPAKSTGAAADGPLPANWESMTKGQKIGFRFKLRKEAARAAAQAGGEACGAEAAEEAEEEEEREAEEEVGAAAEAAGKGDADMEEGAEGEEGDDATLQAETAEREEADAAAA